MGGKRTDQTIWILCIQYMMRTKRGSSMSILRGNKDQARLEGLLPGAVEGKVCTRFPPELFSSNLSMLFKHLYLVASL